MVVADARGQQPVVTWSAETQRLAAASVSGAAPVWTLTLTMADDNGNASLPTSYRRWWHGTVANVTPGHVLNVRIANAGYSDIILPCWSVSTDGGATFGPWTRLPTSAVPTYSGGQHRFSVTVPPGVDTLRLAKYFPYSTGDKDQFVQGLVGHPSGRVRSVTSLGSSVQGRPIELVELTDPTTPDIGKKRIWIHSGIHPAETTSYFAVEGLVEWLLSNDGRAELLLRRAIIDIVPMANPDGVVLGNYRTNARSQNLESGWALSNATAEPEVLRLRQRIEAWMGTAQNPGSNPIEVLLNLHSSHNVSFPFHFLHTSNASWTPGSAGVVPAVHALENRWIQAYRSASPFVNRGSTLSSSCGAPSRPFVECLMHDRWSADPAWPGAPVMAITFEGTYGRGPDGLRWNEPADYRLAGNEMGRALAEYCGISLGATVAAFGSACPGLLTGQVTQPGPGLELGLQVSGMPPSPFGFMVIGFQTRLTQLPFSLGCVLYTDLFATEPFAVDASGSGSLTLPIPTISGLQADLQGVVLDVFQGNPRLTSSHAIRVRATF